MGGTFVFPGGRLDESDRTLAANAALCPPLDAGAAGLPGVDGLDAAAYYVAAIRELFEEAGILLARGPDGRVIATGAPGASHRFAAARAAVHARTVSFAAMVAKERLRLAFDLLAPLSHWVTPASEPRRFDTRFFVARAPADQTADHDTHETVDSLWLTAALALERCARREMPLPPPTLRTLADLEPCRTVAEILDFARRARYERLEPVVVASNDGRILALPGDPAHPEPAPAPNGADTRFILDDGFWRSGRA